MIMVFHESITLLPLLTSPFTTLLGLPDVEQNHDENERYQHHEHHYHHDGLDCTYLVLNEFPNISLALLIRSLPT